MKEFIRKEQEKFRQMTFAEKRWYIWEYYKLHIIGVSIVLFMIGYIIHGRFNPPLQDYMYIAWLDVPASHIQLERLASGLITVVEDPERQHVIITNYSAVQDPQFNMALQARFMAYLRVGAIDVFVIPRQGVYELNIEGFIRPFDEVAAYLSNSEIYDIFNNRLVPLEFDGEIRNMAVSLTGSPFLEEFGIVDDDIYLSIVANTERLSVIARALEVLLYGA